MLLNKEFKEELEGYCEEYQIVVAAKKRNQQVEDVLKLFKEHEIEVRYFENDKAYDEPVLVLGLEYCFDLNETIELLKYQPDNGILLYKCKEYVSYQQSVILKDKSENIYIEYRDKMYPCIHDTIYDGLDEDQASVMSLIDKYDENNSDKKIYDCLFGRNNDKTVVNNLPY